MVMVMFVRRNIVESTIDSGSERQTAERGGRRLHAVSSCGCVLIWREIKI